MAEALKYILDLIQRFVSLLDGIKFVDFFGIAEISYFDLIVAFICVSMVITIFWRGAKG